MYLSKMCRVEKIIKTSQQGHFFKNSLLRNSCLITFEIMQKQPPEKFFKKDVLNIRYIHRKTPVLETFLIRNIAKCFRAPILKNICERLLLKMFMKLRKVKNY